MWRTTKGYLKAKELNGRFPSGKRKTYAKTAGFEKITKWARTSNQMDGVRLEKSSRSLKFKNGSNNWKFD